MDALILVGSGHVNSTCFKIAEEIEKILNKKQYSSNIYQLADLDIRDCLGCEYCKFNQNTCIIEDEMQKFYKKINKTDLLIFVSPIYFSNFPATIKKVIDRCQLYYNLINKEEIKNKNFLGIHIGGAPKYPLQFEAVKTTYQVFLPNLKVKKTDFINISGTDKVNPFEDKTTLNKIISEVDQFVS